MPLKPGKSKRAFESNIKTEMEHGKPQPQALAIAYSVKRKAKRKAAGGSVESGSRDMNYADGGKVGGEIDSQDSYNSDANSAYLKQGFKDAASRGEKQSAQDSYNKRAMQAR